MLVKIICEEEGQSHYSHDSQNLQCQKKKKNPQGKKKPFSAYHLGTL